MSRRRLLGPAALLAALLAALAVAGCSSHTSSEPLRPHWTRVELPLPPGPAGRVVVRDATSCGGQWYLAGAIIGADEASRPAMWTSTDAHTWTSMRLDPHDPWAQQAILYSVACRGNSVAALGAHSGGAHGNPRTNSWYQRNDGTLVDMRAPFELYGGPQALAVKRIVAGPAGWLIAGSRVSGAAVWTSTDASVFRLHDHDPGLASDAQHTTAALAAVADSAGWTVVGRDEITGRISAVPAAWRSTDARHWERQPVPPDTRGFADLEQVTPLGDRLLAAGVRGERFGLWQRVGSTWSAGASFGSITSGSGQPAFVSGLAMSGPDALVTVSDGSRFRLWRVVRTTAREVVLPVRIPSTGDTQVTIAAAGKTVLMLTDDGRAGRVWLSD